MRKTAAIENGFVHLPEQASWLPDYLLEMTSFPKGKYADQVDSTSQALHWIQTRQYQKGMGIFYYMKELYEKQLARESGE